MSLAREDTSMRAATLLFASVACAMSATAFAQPAVPNVVWSRPAGAETVAFSPNGEFVASGGLQSRNPFALGRVDLWAASDGAQLAHAETHGETGAIGYTEDVAFSPDGLTLASANGSTYCGAIGGCASDRPGLFLWGVPSLVPGSGRVDLTPASALGYSPDGSVIAVAYYHDNAGADRTHGATDLATLQEFPGHQHRANDVAWSPDGSLIASVGDDGYLRLWIAETGSLALTLFHGDHAQGGEPVSVAFSPDGALIATAGDGYSLRTKVWRVSDGELVHDLDAQITPTSYGRNVVAFTPNGSYLVGGFQQYVSRDHWRGRIRFWSVATGEVVADYAESGPAPNFGGVTSLAFSPAQDHRFAYTVRGEVKVAETALSLSTPVLDVTPRALEVRVGEALPNPARSSVTVTVEVASAQDVRAALFDALGRRVAKLFDGRLHPGAPEELSFDSRGLAGGRYLIRIEMPGGTITRAVSLVR
jgi:hypothetical protein